MTIPTFRIFSSDRIGTWIIRALHIGALLALMARDGEAQDFVSAHPRRTIVGVALSFPGYSPHTPMVVPGAGVSFVGVTDVDTEIHAQGWNANIGLLAKLSRSTAFRAGVTAHHFKDVKDRRLYEMGLAWYVK